MCERKKTLSISPQIILHMKSHSERDYPFEACGLLAGRNHDVKLIIPVTNISESKDEFQMEPQEQIEAFLRIENEEYDLLAIYHSHPNGLSLPSKKDLSSHYYPGVYAVILSPKNCDWQIRVFELSQGGYEEVEYSLKT